MKRKLSLLIGTGKRAKYLVTALKYLNYNDIYILGSSWEKSSNFSEQFDVNASKSYEDISNKHFENIIIATDSKDFLSILEKIKNFKFSKKFNIFLEIPILGGLKNIFIRNYEKYFSNIFYCEDYKYSPLLKDHGSPKKISYIGTGYHLHSLAFGFMISKKKNLLFARKISDSKFFFYFSDLKVSINMDNIKEKIIIFENLSKKTFHLNEINEKCKKLINLSNLIYQNKNDNAYFIRIYSLINLFSFHSSSGDKYLNLDNGIYESLVIKIINKFGFFIDINIYNFSLFKTLIVIYFYFLKFQRL